MLQNSLVLSDITPMAIVSYSYLSVTLDSLCASCFDKHFNASFTAVLSCHCPGCSLEVTLSSVSRMAPSVCPSQAWFCFFWCCRGKAAVYITKSALEVCRCLNNRYVKLGPPGVLRGLAWVMACLTTCEGDQKLKEMDTSKSSSLLLVF